MDIKNIIQQLDEQHEREWHLGIGHALIAILALITLLGIDILISGAFWYVLEAMVR